MGNRKMQGWTLVAVWVSAALGIWFLASIAGEVDGWMFRNQHLSNWAQAIGTVAAIFGAAWLAGGQERRARHDAKQIAIKKARTLGIIVQAVAEEVRVKGSRWVLDSKLRRMVLEEAVLDAREIPSDLLNLNWIMAIQGLRSIAVQMCEVMKAFEEAPKDPVGVTRPFYRDLGTTESHVKMAVAVAEYEPQISVHLAVVTGVHPGVRSYAEE